jgi:hypothetical protein
VEVRRWCEKGGGTVVGDGGVVVGGGGSRDPVPSLRGCRKFC